MILIIGLYRTKSIQPVVETLSLPAKSALEVKHEIYTDNKSP